MKTGRKPKLYALIRKANKELVMVGTAKDLSRLLNTTDYDIYNQVRKGSIWGIYDVRGASQEDIETYNKKIICLTEEEKQKAVRPEEPKKEEKKEKKKSHVAVRTSSGVRFK